MLIEDFPCSKSNAMPEKEWRRSVVCSCELGHAEAKRIE
jgi:hypothetical protein